MKSSYSLLALAIGASMSASALADISDIIISEYVENGANSTYTRAVELTNIGVESHTFDSTYSLYHKHAAGWTNEILAADGAPILHGLSIQPNSSIVILHPESHSRDEIEAIVAANDGQVYFSGTYDQVQNGSLNFTGSSAVLIAESGLVDKEEPTDIQDIVGYLGQYNWGETVTLRRQEGAVPSSSYNPNDWTQHPGGTYDGLGSPELDEPVEPGQICSDNPGFAYKSITEIQGTGDRSPLVPDGSFWSDESYRLSGIVAHVTTGNSTWRGVYLQDVVERSDREGSDGIFVEVAGVDESLVGQEICFVGKVQELFNRTQFVPSDSDYQIMNSNSVAPRVTPLEIIASDYNADGELEFNRTLERHEGMLITLPQDVNPDQDGDQDMRVTRTFMFDYSSFRNNMVLSYERPNLHPNQLYPAASDDAMALHKQNETRRLFVESDEKAPDGTIPYYPEFADAPNDHVILVNDSVVGITGVLDYSHSEYRLIPSENVSKDTFKQNTPRTTSPSVPMELESDEFALKLVASNVLNYFNSPFGGDRNRFGENRGAESYEEFERQQAKIVEVLYQLDADVVGLVEVENNGFGDYSAIAQLVDELNSKYTDDRYSNRNGKDSIYNRYRFIGFDSNGDAILDAHDHVGTDAITNGLIYRPTKVMLDSSRIIEMPNQNAPSITDENGNLYVDSQGRPLSSGRAFQRHAVAATFIVNNTGKQLTVAVNHFKSKGSNCIDDWDGWEEWENFTPGDSLHDDDLQGQCENFRVAAAHQLGKELSKIPGDQVILGDLNAYAYEDAVLVLTDNPTGKTLRAGQHTYIGERPQFGSDQSGVEIKETFGYVNAVKLMDDKFGRQPSWSFSYNDTLGSLDHVLVTPSMTSRIRNAADWHINSTESTLFDYTTGYKGSNPENFHDQGITPWRSSDHDPVITAVAYRYAEPGTLERRFITISSRAEIPYVIRSTAEAKAGDKVQFSLTARDDQDMSRVTLAEPILTEDGEQTLLLELSGVEYGKYRFSMILTRDGKEVPDSQVTFDGIIAKPDSLAPEINIPRYDKSGGSTGFLSLFGLLGLVVVRKTRLRLLSQR
ncbi:ExeM/NucH family extracellular endonuclease [Photobacterium sp. ZSDE20]|uniref:ExeM/NucH family extracellular endonuclease n=1 Tax=Photobacterium pectinilyticum TaxID=2906793 RepID=A0ABT1N2W4_9GAMM|nr:ExeM/NucH family extracellular endonuclease [Photobacterium sp. ZSDE20]MCQ1059088.1 ExeM/NucH family extracellular endonuclease [Photobacterium sp. ZSDE20]MDD1824169.1 ExeM/NucH family extracellular endonuclease [Photobacterium sp. ZSDE20]